MIKLLGKIPNEVWLGFSGGVDSVVVADFLRRGKTKINLVFIHHNTQNSEAACGFVQNFAKSNSLNLVVRYIDNSKEKSQSLEEFWRIERYKVFREFPVLITAHHLNDAVETWLWRSLNGHSRTIEYRNQNVIRPFLLNRKEEFYKWAENKSLNWIDDTSNYDVKYTRNKIRHELLPKALEIQPGLFKVVKKQILADFKDQNS